MKTLSKTYAEKDATRTPVEWQGLDCIMLGTISEAGILRRMDGCPVTAEHRPVNPSRLSIFSLTGQWLFPIV